MNRSEMKSLTFFQIFDPAWFRAAGQNRLCMPKTPFDPELQAVAAVSSGGLWC
jgi:hypothetical protein